MSPAKKGKTSKKTAPKPAPKAKPAKAANRVATKAEQAADATVRATKKAANETTKVAKRAASETSKAAKKAASETGKAAKRAGAATTKAAKAALKAVEDAASKVGSRSKKATPSKAAKATKAAKLAEPDEVGEEVLIHDHELIDAAPAAAGDFLCPDCTCECCPEGNCPCSGKCADTCGCMQPCECDCTDCDCKTCDDECDCTSCCCADGGFACSKCQCECCPEGNCPCKGDCDDTCGCQQCCGDGCECEDCGEDCRCGHDCGADCSCCHGKTDVEPHGHHEHGHESEDHAHGHAAPVAHAAKADDEVGTVELDDEDLDEAPGPAKAQAPADDHVGEVSLDEDAPVHTEPKLAAAMPEAGLDAVTQFLILSNEPGWDVRREKVKAGAWGAPLVGAFLMELALRGQLRIQRDRLVLSETTTHDGNLGAFMADLAKVSQRGSQDAMERLGKTLSLRLKPYKAALVHKGVARSEAKSLLGMADRSTFEVDTDLQERTVNRMTRALAGSGTPDARAIALMGLVEASGLLASLVPSSALAFSRQRIKGLLSGSDRLGYKVDPGMKALSGVLLNTILANVKVLSGRGP